MRKFNYIVLALLVFGLYACKKGNDPKPNPDSDPQKELKVFAESFQGKVKDGAAAETVIGKVDATTSDKSALKFALEDKTGALKIDATSGEIKVADPSKISFKDNPVIKATYSATSGDVTESASVSVNVIEDLEKRMFITTWVIPDGNKTVTFKTNLLLPSSEYNATIDWGDGESTALDATAVTSNLGKISHTYADADTYQIKIGGQCPAISLNASIWDPETREITVNHWGVHKWKSMYSMFRKCKKLIYSPDDTPDLSQCTEFESMFSGCTDFNSDISNWDVSNAKTMAFMFSGTAFNQDLSAWASRVGNVTDMEGVFDSTPFNQDISSWDVSKVTNMNYLFYGTPFNQDLSAWASKLGNVTTMKGMFESSKFNQDITSWQLNTSLDCSDFCLDGVLKCSNLPTYISTNCNAGCK